MNKRKRSLDDEEQESKFAYFSKRQRIGDFDVLSRLSDEVLVRILSFLSVPDLAQCQKLSRRLAKLATDSQLWKSLYHQHFVRPRAARIPGISNKALRYSSRTSIWLDDRHLLCSSPVVDWKAQYRLRHNWVNGSPQASGFLLPDHTPPVPPLIRAHGDYAIAVDPRNGLRAWRVKGQKSLIASQALSPEHSISPSTPLVPTALALDSRHERQRPISTIIGLSDGSWQIHDLDHHNSCRFRERYKHPPALDGAITALAYHYPYLVTLSEKHQFCAYKLHLDSEHPETHAVTAELLCTLKSHTSQLPLSVSLRALSKGVLASLAFIIPSYSKEWEIGIQELQIDPDGAICKCRIAVAAVLEPLNLSQTTRNLNHDTKEPNYQWARSLSASNGARPSSISYTHPYLLIARQDNTLMLHVVKSSSSQLSISSGHRLWGHTSSVSDVQVGERGKAISASAAGDELRVWDLERALPLEMRSAVAISSTSIRSTRAKALQSSAEDGAKSTISYDHRVVGFDHEKIVTMREEGQRALMIYDFS